MRRNWLPLATNRAEWMKGVVSTFLIHYFALIGFCFFFFCETKSGEGRWNGWNGLVRSSCRCKLQTMPSIFNGIHVSSVWRYLNLQSIPSFCVLGGTGLVRLRRKDHTPTCHQARVCPKIFWAHEWLLSWRSSLLHLPCCCPLDSWLFVLMASAFFSFTIRHL